MTTLDTKALVWLGEGDGFKSFTRSKATAEKWRRGNIHVTPVSAVSPSQGEGPAADVVERLQGWLDGTFAYAAYRGKAPDGVPQFRDDLRDALASLAPRAAQEAPADEQSGETSHVGEAVAGPQIMFVCDYCSEHNPEMCGHYDARDVRLAPNGKWLCEDCYDEEAGADAARFSDAPKAALSALAHPLPLKEEVERVLDDNSLQARIGSVGNELHNLGCEYQSDETLSERLGALASQLWELARLSRIRAGAQEGWRPIETAPKCGTHFLAYELTGEMYRACYHRDGYLIAYCGQPVVQAPEPDYWLPLDALPKRPEPYAPSPEAKGGRS